MCDILGKSHRLRRLRASRLVNLAGGCTCPTTSVITTSSPVGRDDLRLRRSVQDVSLCVFDVSPIRCRHSCSGEALGGRFRFCAVHVETSVN